MLRYLFADNLARYPLLSQTMFRDRAIQFRDRLGWEVSVDAAGQERDQYDGLNPLYVIWQRPDGRHGGSMRFLPTTGRTMIAEHFAHLVPECGIHDPQIWECTRFCLAPGADARVAALLMLAGGELMRFAGVRQFAGVFDARMVRIYRAIGASPTVLGSEGMGRDQISAGLWRFDPSDRARVLSRARLSSQVSEAWFARSFPDGWIGWNSAPALRAA